MGDLNVNIQDEMDPKVIEYSNILAQSGFVACIDSTTRETAMSTACLDHIFVRSKNDLFENMTSFILRTF